MAGERFGVANIDQTLEQFQSVVNPFSGLQSAGNTKGYQRASTSAEVFLRQRVIGTIDKAGVINPRYAWIAVQEFGDWRPFST